MDSLESKRAARVPGIPSLMFFVILLSFVSNNKFGHSHLVL